MVNNTVLIQIHFPVIDVVARIFYPRLYDFCQEAMEKVFSQAVTKDEMGNEVKFGVIADWVYRTKQFPVVVRAESDYLAPIRLGEELSVKVVCSHVGKTSFHLEYFFENQANSLLKAKAKTIHVFTSEGGEKLDLPISWRNFLQELK